MKKALLACLSFIFILGALACVGYGFVRTSGMSVGIYEQDFEIRNLKNVLTEHELSQANTSNDRVCSGSAADAGAAVARYQMGMDVDVSNLFHSNDDACRWYHELGCTWSFETSYMHTGTSIPVVWLCRSQDGELLAYTLADYIIESGVFTNVACHEAEPDDVWGRFDSVAIVAHEHDDVTSDTESVDDDFGDFDFEGREGLTPEILRRIIASGYNIPDKEPEKEGTYNYGMTDDVDFSDFAKE